MKMGITTPKSISLFSSQILKNRKSLKLQLPEPSKLRNITPSYVNQIERYQGNPSCFPQELNWLRNISYMKAIKQLVKMIFLVDKMAKNDDQLLVFSRESQPMTTINISALRI